MGSYTVLKGVLGARARRLGLRAGTWLKLASSTRKHTVYRLWLEVCKRYVSDLSIWESRTVDRIVLQVL
jgi:hypothetical protein